jgi:pilus assembly protein Flp/PilA
MLVKLIQSIAMWRGSEKGATAVEYGLIVALIAVVIIIAVALLGTNLDAIFNFIANRIGEEVPA